MKWCLKELWEQRDTNSIAELIAVWGDKLREHERFDVGGYEMNIFLVELIGSERLDK